ncbi:tRNA pseudouridine(55) synthase TruB [Larsenimonas salina]|uniref:tRNA pseudouridine(55) synthase TruB n=1 Tax=Larsenimonas salina TaxID=1295565 RepID=UPI002073BEBB|nr:tRNA pseudouridine(55) synthase TruB [Larsenimonas salina]MCM5705306.1 tRNA pseudouridine(55) synthase TruB [Larsenimonas salina]
MARHRKGRPISGVLLLDKPYGVSSNRALQKARGLFQAQKAGHTGTLDPMATGLLPVLFGEATKFSSLLLDADKRYQASLRLGQTTATGDAEGDILSERPVPELESSRLEHVLAQFTGDIEQIPPMYSALKHEGRPLYELAREGREIKRAPRAVSVYHIGLLETRESGFSIDVTCSKGTYIRTLAMDIGETLGCGAHLDALRRFKTGPFDAESMVTLEVLEHLSDDERQARLLPIDALLTHLPSVEVDDDSVARFRQGQALTCNETYPSQTLIRVYDRTHTLLGVALLNEGQLAPKRVINTAEDI